MGRMKPTPMKSLRETETLISFFYMFTTFIDFIYLNSGTYKVVAIFRVNK